MAKGRKGGPSRMDLRRQSDAAEARETEDKTEEVEDEEADDEDEEEAEEEEADDEAAAATDDEAGGDDEDDDEDAPKKKKAKAKAKPKAKKEPAKPKAKRTRAVKVVTMKAVWVVFDNSNKRLNTFAYNQKPEAEEFLAKKQEEKKNTCYLQLVKEEMKEKAEKV